MPSNSAVGLPSALFAVECLGIDLSALDGQELIGRLIRYEGWLLPEDAHG